MEILAGGSELNFQESEFADATFYVVRKCLVNCIQSQHCIFPLLMTGNSISPACTVPWGCQVPTCWLAVSILLSLSVNDQIWGHLTEQMNIRELYHLVTSDKYFKDWSLFHVWGHWGIGNARYFHLDHEQCKIHHNLLSATLSQIGSSVRSAVSAYLLLCVDFWGAKLILRPLIHFYEFFY